MVTHTCRMYTPSHYPLVLDCIKEVEPNFTHLSISGQFLPEQKQYIYNEYEFGFNTYNVMGFELINGYYCVFVDCLICKCMQVTQKHG